MWSFLLTGGSWISHAWSWFESFSTTMLGVFFLIAAFAFFVYSFIDIRIPRFIVAPICCILVFAGAWLTATQRATDYQLSQCDIRFNVAQQQVNDRELEASIKIKDLEQKLSITLVQAAQTHAQDSADLNKAIDDARAHPSKDELIPPLEQDNEQDNEQVADSGPPVDIPDYIPAPPSKTDVVQPPPVSEPAKPSITVVVAPPRSCIDAPIPTSILSVIRRASSPPVSASK